MNLLEIYIEKIHSERPFEADWTKEFPDRKFVEVDITTDCYGRVKRDTHVFNTDMWKKIKEQGYYMG